MIHYIKTIWGIVCRSKRTSFIFPKCVLLVSLRRNIPKKQTKALYFFRNGDRFKKRLANDSKDIASGKWALKRWELGEPAFLIIYLVELSGWKAVSLQQMFTNKPKGFLPRCFKKPCILGSAVSAWLLRWR